MNYTRKTHIGAATTLAIVTMLLTPFSASATSLGSPPPESGPESLATILEDAEMAAVGEATPADAEVPTPTVEGGAVTVELAASDVGVALGSSTDVTISESGQYATVEDASVTYAVSHPEEGSTRFAAILDAPVKEQPQWTFDEGTQLLLLDNGTVSISDGENFIGGIDAPWAVDAEGRTLPTHYEIAGSTLRQVVDTTGATFPVVADPTVNFYGPYIQVHLNRSESLAAISGFSACAAVLNKSKVSYAKLLQVACATVVAISGTRLAGGNCVSIHYVVGVGGPAGIWWPWIHKC